MAESYMGGELGEAAALLNASTQHNMGETSFAEHVKDIYVGTGDSFLGMLRRGKIHQEQVAHMVLAAVAAVRARACTAGASAARSL